MDVVSCRLAQHWSHLLQSSNCRHYLCAQNNTPYQQFFLCSVIWSCTARFFFFKVNSHFNSSYILTEHCKISVLRKKVMYFNKSLFNHNWNPDWKFNWPIYLFTYLTSFLLNIFASFDSYATIFFTGIPLFLKKDHNLITFYIRPKASENLFNNS